MIPKQVTDFLVKTTSKVAQNSGVNSTSKCKFT